MGTYLSTPVTEKGTEEGRALVESPHCSLAWGVVDMQGWRKSMEDAHVAQTEVALSGTHAKVFGVFDGHGGPEVARFCALYLIDTLQKEPTWRAESPDEQTGPPRLDPAQCPMGLSLIRAFHALDRMIDDMSRRDELLLLRSEKPAPGEQRTADSIPPPAEAENLTPTVDDEQKSEALVENVKAGEEDGEKSDEVTQVDSAPEKEEESKQGGADMIETDGASESGEAKDSGESGREAQEGELDDDSNKAVGLENGPEADDSFGLDREDLDEMETIHFHDFVAAVEGKEGEIVVELSGGGGDEEKSDSSDSTYEDNDEDRPNTLPPATTRVPITASVIQNGRQICNLPDHPVHAGCTAVVAVLVERTLTVANAGDSRAVLCRAGGRAEALSFDHKPQQEREMTRITKAGGFVNQFGRVNGNLNLSRSIGDLKYKQVPGLSPAEQMITAEPDIVQVDLHPEDEFIVLGCDGIWDCLSNDQAIKYVRDRIDAKTPTEIGIEMLDEIISEDPRATQGIGGDNMTVMIVDLMPQKRSYS